MASKKLNAKKIASAIDKMSAAIDGASDPNQMTLDECSDFYKQLIDLIEVKLDCVQQEMKDRK